MCIIDENHSENLLPRKNHISFISVYQVNCPCLWILTECSLLAVLKKGLKSQSLMRVEV